MQKWCALPLPTEAKLGGLASRDLASAMNSLSDLTPSVRCASSTFGDGER
jgi:hypothetical protein